MSENVVNLIKKTSEDTVILISYKDGETREVLAEMFGVLTEMTSNIGFWKSSQDFPFLIVAIDSIKTIELLGPETKGQDAVS